MLIEREYKGACAIVWCTVVWCILYVVFVVKPSSGTEGWWWMQE